MPATRLPIIGYPLGVFVPMTAIREEEINKLMRIEEELHKRIISQNKAIGALSRAIRRSRARRRH